MATTTCLARFALASALLFAVLMGPAQAVTMNSGDVVVFNFDFTGQTPAPPYENIDATFAMANVDLGDTASAEIFGGLNGTGGLLFSVSSSQMPTAFLGFVLGDPLFAPAFDGLFSIVIAAQHGPFDFTSITAVATGLDANGGNATVTATIGRLTVPEPSSLALAGLALFVVFGALRRR